MTLEWLFRVKIRFQPARLESERLNVKKIIQPLRFRGVLCIARSVSQPIGRHAQLTRCFSAVAEAELLVLTLIWSFRKMGTMGTPGSNTFCQCF